MNSDRTLVSETSFVSDKRLSLYIQERTPDVRRRRVFLRCGSLTLVTSPSSRREVYVPDLTPKVHHGNPGHWTPRLSPGAR